MYSLYYNVVTTWLNIATLLANIDNKGILYYYFTLIDS